MPRFFEANILGKLLLHLAAIGFALLALRAPLAAEAGPRRIALVVGVADYQAVAPLRNTLNDASRMAATLERLGFDVTRIVNPQRAVFAEALREFGAKAQGADTSLFFYAGHALEVNGRNWLLPVDARVESALDLSLAAIDVESVLDRGKLASTAIMFLDACRNNPFAERLAAGNRGVATRGLARIDPPSRVLVAFATAPGQVALDGTGANSPFTEALLHYMETPGLEIRQLMSRVRAEVRQATHDQVPWEQSALEGDFFFVPAKDIVAVAPPPAAPPALDADALFWDSVRASKSAADYAAYLSKFPFGIYARLASSRIVALSAPPSAPEAGAPVLPSAAVVAALVPLPAPPAPVTDPAPLPPPIPVASGASPVAAPGALAAPPTPAVPVPPPAPEPAVAAPTAAATPVVPSPPVTVAVAIAPPAVPDRAALTRQLQERLKVLGCYRGEIDGDWNSPAAGSAMARLVRVNRGMHLPGEASEDLLTRLAAKDVRVCAPECRKGFELQQGTCARIACDSGEVRNSRGICINIPQASSPKQPRAPRRVVRVPAPEPDPVPVQRHQQRRIAVEVAPEPIRHPRPHVVRERPPAGGGGGGGRCFTVDGRQFCS